MYAIDKLNFDEESNFMPHARALTQLVVAFHPISKRHLPRTPLARATSSHMRTLEGKRFLCVGGR
jgi:hypothetical protein